MFDYSHQMGGVVCTNKTSFSSRVKDRKYDKNCYYAPTRTVEFRKQALSFVKHLSVNLVWKVVKKGKKCAQREDVYLVV